LKNIAAEWWDLQSEEVHHNWEDSLAAFTQRFVDNDLVKWQKAGEFWTRAQGPMEVVDKYAASLRKIGRSMDAGDDVIRHAFIRGLHGNLRG